MNEQEKFFRDVLRQIWTLRSEAKNLRTQADKLDDISLDLENLVNKESTGLRIDPFDPE